MNELVKQKKKVDIFYIYLRALTLKRQGKNEQAKKDYM